MTEILAASAQNRNSSRRVLIALGLAAAALLVAMVVVSHLGRVVAARHAPLKNAIKIELELVRANLGYELVLNDDPAASIDSVQQYLVRAEWYAQDMVEVCSSAKGRLFVAPIAPLRRKLAVLSYELRGFIRMTRERRNELEATNGQLEPDSQYDEAFRQVALRSRETKVAADTVLRIEQGVLNTLQVGLVAGVLILATFVAMTLLRYLQRQRQVDIALHESEERFRSLYRDSNDAVMFLDENTFLDCNEASLRIFQLESYKEFRRKHPGDLSPPTQPDGTDSTTLANERIETALREGSHRFEWTHQRSDGTTFPAEVLLRTVHLEGRKVLQAVVQDVTQHLDSERRLRSNEEKLRTISDAALDAVIMMDAAGRAVHWNPAAEKMFGYSAEEVIGQAIHQLLTPPRLQEGASRALAHFHQTGEGRAVGRTLELQALRNGGDEFPIEISVAPIRVEGQWNAVAVIRDITDRKLAEEKLRAEQHTLRRLLKAHDQERKLIAYEIHDGLAQQLVAAIMQCQSVAWNDQENRTELAGGVQELLQRCLSETRRLISGLRPPILDEFGVVTAIEGLLQETEMGDGPEVEFHNEVAFHRLEPVLENAIYRVIQEGLGNACRHSKSPRVRVDLEQRDERIVVRIQDWGVGFDPQQIERGRYGLAGIRERARLLGGDVTVESQPGEGTTISVELPIDVGDLSE